MKIYITYDNEGDYLLWLGVKPVKEDNVWLVPKDKVTTTHTILPLPEDINIHLELNKYYLTNNNGIIEYESQD